MHASCNKIQDTIKLTAPCSNRINLVREIKEYWILMILEVLGMKVFKQISKHFWKNVKFVLLTPRVGNYVLVLPTAAVCFT